MAGVDYVIGIDHRGRINHVWASEAARMTSAESLSFLGRTIGANAASKADGRLLRATLTDCKYDGKPQECVVRFKSGQRVHIRFEKVKHGSEQMLRVLDEVSVIAIARELPQEVVLSEREIKIIRFVCRELTSVQIAREMKLSLSTIESLRRNLREKVGAKGSVGIALYALRQGLVS